MIEFPVCINVEKLVETAGQDKLFGNHRNQLKVTMALEMKEVCEKCGGKVVANGEAYICVYECTFCVACAGDMATVCPNCGGELVRRPRAGKVERTSL